MNETKRPLGITDVVLRDAHQSLFATRLRLDDMLPIAEKLDKVGYWSLETWGGATFDACIRYLGEDPWERIRALKEAMPNTPQAMLLRGQNLLGYRHYADDVVDKFVERAKTNGVDVFRVFDAMNDPRNLERAIKAVRQVGGHAQGTISYTVSPVHTLDSWVDLAKTIAAMGADSLAIKDMAGLLTPYTAYDLVSRLKKELSIPVHLHCHATTGLSTSTILKAVEAGVDNVDTAISSMSMTYGHSPTESVVAMLKDTDRDTGLDLELLEDIAGYFREVRKKYASFEGSLRGIDSRILVAQVPGGMLTNMESQLKEQGAGDKLDDVLSEIPRVREDLGFIPLVTPTSQIVGTQAVMNVMMGERYKSISKEVQALLKGEYGSAPAPFNAELQKRVLEGGEPITCRPADNLSPEMDKLAAELKEKASADSIRLAEGEREVDDVLTYALFPQIGLKFLKNRDNKDAFEPAPEAPQAAAPAKAEAPAAAPAPAGGPETYTVKLNGKAYVVEVSEGGEIGDIQEQPAAQSEAAAPAPSGESIDAPLAGNIFKVNVRPGDQVAEGDVVIILEAMKMETEVRASSAGTVSKVNVSEGDSVAVGDALIEL
ncbi:MAG: sodium-extruding oxaloacetate decarboxylase subunit alpha [Halomonas sp.]|mgnify:FL=1|jgi:oxaloacetate decarboxylase alpha subunit|uniref:Oxaloacetate decarboxylase n=1 Tax=Vreelandella aquamarina TaxID=77097 RepID=A0A0D7UVN6_9GAMM|nr:MULTISPECIES: sodium-extruding oxaloacetate decarboxylase subunit alpha [Halomonas]MEC9306137.1 sodium-extruding oxaloacetate decarboxylase subunit alpha [Pseudomonadota bacterium]KJD18729.1 oxaloacetate decarboxylase [Halomonas meridiana]MCD1651473.1 sodium-extruding oxaloacetate decarboxylase subunit alpha [Halomonas axialensis]MCD2087670.1 sodium-extruding oxaloacetate decarboxylase subunit alpha [Halomonas meridiana]MCF2914084.1 sodium-extruding oxaloacetate decarboxylase subunit alpha |tara:strand:+ start:98 stop:1900 length:1803 start_codon:yes stop_codon:yes gene_type:complete